MIIGLHNRKVALEPFQPLKAIYYPIDISRHKAKRKSMPFKNDFYVFSSQHVPSVFGNICAQPFKDLQHGVVGYPCFSSVSHRRSLKKSLFLRAASLSCLIVVRVIDFTTPDVDEETDRDREISVPYLSLI